LNDSSTADGLAQYMTSTPRYEPAPARELTNAVVEAAGSSPGSETFPLLLSARILERPDFPTRSSSFTPGDRLPSSRWIRRGASPEGTARLREAGSWAEASADAARLRRDLAAVAAHTRGAPPADDRTLVVLTLE
jgi:hypothetical protein